MRVADQVLDVAMSLNLLPRKEPRLVAGLVVAYFAGATQNGPIKRQDAGSLEELQGVQREHQPRVAGINQHQHQLEPVRKAPIRT